MKFRNIKIKLLLPLAATLAFAAAPAIADEADPELKVTFITDAAQGKAISKKQYELAARRLENASGQGIEEFYINNNLCVSYLKLGELARARVTCDAAVERIEMLVKKTRKTSTKAHDYERMLEFAVTNREVVYVVSEAEALTLGAA